MDIDRLREDLIIDEGTKNEIYLDHLGLPTFGIGHLVTEWDEEYEFPVGTPISTERVNQCFQVDVHGTINECKILFEDFDDLPEEVQLIIGNLMFNMGRPRLSKFVLFRKAVKDRDWIECGYQLKNSRYYTQVTARADRLIARLQAIQSQ
tara:strand:+ start:1180 stop:1629 length:450 start_codon:yes stop_codon:yes gene_type:complete